jgi:nucleoside-diphosphate-sugar epimerase
LRVCIVGAGGGIGQRLVETFAKRHEVAGVYRSLSRAPGRSDIEPVRYGDAAALARSVGTAQVVIHAALNSKARGEAFLRENRAITETLLSDLDAETCRLFVYFSSQVVYSAYLPKDGRYSEQDALAVTEPVDSYTRLKLEDERRVIEACGAAGIPYLIVRPTVVMGPGMAWSSGIVSAMRVAPVGIRHRTMNLVHVDDLSADLLTLIERGVRNEIYNLGDLDVETDDYFGCAGDVARRRVWFLPDGVARGAARFIPSTLWFLRSDVRIDCSKIKRATRRDRSRPLRDYFPRGSWRVDGDDLETIARIARQKQPFEVQGQGYSAWFNDPAKVSRLSLAHYSGIISLEDDLVTVKAGTPLSVVLDYLDRHGLTLATLPEFGGVSAGACFFTEVHGSSAEFVSMYDLIERIGYVDSDGVETTSLRHAGWEHMRRMTSGLVVTQVSFRCVPLRQFSNRIEWRPDYELETYVAGKARENISTTIQWYPNRGRLLVYNVNEASQRERGDALPFLPFRGLPYGWQRFLIALRMRGKGRIVGKSYEILAPWKAVPARPLVGRLLMALKSRLKNMEVCVPSQRAPEFVARLREAITGGTIAMGRGQGVGVRFTAHPETGRSFAWIETTSQNVEQLHKILLLAREVCGEEYWLHRGKYVPQGVPADMLFVPRLRPMVVERRTRVAAGR